MVIQLAVSGCRGRMGQRIVVLAAADSRFRVVTGLEHAGHADLGKDLGRLSGTNVQGVRVTDDVAGGLKGSDCLIEFSSPQATLEHVEPAYLQMGWSCLRTPSSRAFARSIIPSGHPRASSSRS